MRSKLIGFMIALVVSLGQAVPILAQQAEKETQKISSPTARVAAGQKQKITGVIIRRDAESFILRDLSGIDYTVELTDRTRVEEKKSNPFRRARNYGMTSLLRGLNVEVEGRGGSSGALVAEKIRIREADLMTARTVETRVTPVEGRLGETEARLSQAEENARRLSGQIEELNAISNAARGGAKAAQETADAALAGVQATNERITTLISELDQYEPKATRTINFKVASAWLSPEAKTSLDEIASQAKVEKGFIIEVKGYASADGNEEYNRRLSQRRADAVVRYLAEIHNIPLRRIIIPFGYGESNPVADNSTREGREQNRRVEVTVLVNRGLTSPPAAPSTQRTRISSDTRP